MAYVPPLNGGRINASIGGNSTSAGAGYALISTGTMVLAGGNNITLSQNGNNITISAPNTPTGSINFSASNTSANLASVTFSNSNNVSFGLSAGVITASITNQSNQSLGLYGVGNTTQNSSTTLDARTLSFNGLGGATVGYSNGSIQISAPQTVAQTNQTVGLYALGNTTQNSSTTLDARSLSFNGLGMITAGYSNGSIQLSATQSNQDLSLYALGNTTQNSSTVLNASKMSFNGLGGATVGFSNGSIQISGNTGGGGGVALYDGANSISSGTARFSNSNGVSFGFNGQTITGSVAAQTNQTVGLYALGNTTQNSSTTLDARTMSFNGLGAATMGYSNGSIQVSAPPVSSLSVTGALSLSTNGSTVSIGAPATSSLSGVAPISISTNGSTISLLETPASQYIHNSAVLLGTSASTLSTFAQTSLSIVRMFIPYALSFTRVDIPVSVNVATAGTAATAAMAVSNVAVLYTRNGATLNPVAGISGAGTFSFNSNNTGSVTGAKMLSFNLATSISAGEYYMGLQLSTNTASSGTATTNLAWSLSVIYGQSYSALPWTDFHVGTASTINAMNVMQGMNSVSLSTTNQTVQQSQITHYGATGVRANLIVGFKNN